MIVVSVLAVFAALFLLVLMALPGPHVKKSRLGIERERLNLGKSMDAFLERHGKRRGLAQALNLADVSTEPGQFALRIVIGSALLGVLGLLVSPILGLILVATPYFLVRTWVSHKGTKRQEAFAEQLPDVLQLLITSLRSGYGLPQALTSVSEEAQEPSRSEYQHMLAEAQMGRDLPAALRSLAARMNNEDLEWVVGAIEINRETGGNLAEILENVQGTIRERQRMGRKVRSFTAEGRLTARILTAMPFLLGLWQWRAHPDDFSILFHGVGLLVLAACGVLMILGWFWIKRLTIIKF
jgi:tight adherence protein B